MYEYVPEDPDVTLNDVIPGFPEFQLQLASRTES